MRKGIAISAGLAAVLLVAGCTPKFDGKIAGKQINENKVQIKFKICVRASEGNECAAPAPRQARGEEDYFHLLAFRVPRGTDAPEDFSTRDGNVDYTRNRSYGRELRDLAPTPDGTRWFGFVSDAIGEDDPERTRYRLRFGLQDDPGKVFKHRPVTGFGISNGQIDCGDDAFEPSKSEDVNTVCISDPTKRRRVRKSLKIELD